MLYVDTYERKARNVLRQYIVHVGITEARSLPYHPDLQSELARFEPPNAEWHWGGCKRTAGSRKGGGVGVLRRSNTTWTRLEAPCNEHMWISGELLGMPVLVGVVYLSVARAEDTENCYTIECIKRYVIRWVIGKQVLLMGDFNGHIQPLYGYQDVNGYLVSNWQKNWHWK